MPNGRHKRIEIDNDAHVGLPKGDNYMTTTVSLSHIHVQESQHSSRNYTKKLNKIPENQNMQNNVYYAKLSDWMAALSLCINNVYTCIRYSRLG